MDFLWLWMGGDGAIASTVCSFAGPCATASMRKVCRATRRHTPKITTTTAPILWPDPPITDGRLLVEYLRKYRRNSNAGISSSDEEPQEVEPRETTQIVDEVWRTCLHVDDRNPHPVTYIQEIGGGPLHIAAAQGMIRVVMVLVYFNADILGRDSAQRTPLHHGAYGGHSNVCRFLLEKGADVEARDGLGKQAIDLALRRRGGMPEELSEVLTIYMQFVHDAKERAGEHDTKMECAIS